MYDGLSLTTLPLRQVNEGRKILHLPNFKASVTCVRVPVYRAHSVAVTAEFERPVSLAEARVRLKVFFASRQCSPVAAKEALRAMPGLDYLEENSAFPTPLSRASVHNVAVGRLRVDSALDNGLSFFVVGDQILKGAALNAVQIAQKMVEYKLL